MPESQCTKCHPALAAKFKADGDWCKTHGVPESHCYQCNPDLTFPAGSGVPETEDQEQGRKQPDAGWATGNSALSCECDFMRDR